MAYTRQSLPRYGQCDSYFVESEDDGIYILRAEQRERARAIARMQQRALAEELSRITADEYKDDVMSYMEQMESQTLPDVNSIDIQEEIQWYMRPYLLDFLIEAHAAFQLLPETLFLAVNLLDRYCSRRVVYKRHYQLVGCAALLIAAKYGDRKERVPTVRELKSMCCSLYDDEMFTQMEWHVLQTLNWVIGHPTIDSFLQIALSEDAYDPEIEHMTWYLCEIALFHKEFVSVRPSTLARSALALARCILRRPQPDESRWSGSYDSSIVVHLSNRLFQPSQVLSRKYSSMHFSTVARTVEEFLHEQAQLARRQQAPPTPVITVAEEPKPEECYRGPHTPQKSQYGSVVQHGCLTPPITPESEDFTAGNVAKPNAMFPPVYPSTPTPMSHPHHLQPQPQQQQQQQVEIHDHYDYQQRCYQPQHVQ